jgi:hypothetical protein
VFPHVSGFLRSLDEACVGKEVSAGGTTATQPLSVEYAYSLSLSSSSSESGDSSGDDTDDDDEEGEGEGGLGRLVSPRSQRERAQEEEEEFERIKSIVMASPCLSAILSPVKEEGPGDSPLCGSTTAAF